MTQLAPSPPAEAIAGPRVVPQAIEAEEAVLGSVLINPDAYFDVAAFLRADDFHDHRHRWIWEAVVSLHDQRVPVDLLTVVAALERHQRLADVGGQSALLRLIKDVPTSLHAEAYGRMVEQAAVRRRLLTAAGDIARLAYDERTDVEQAIDGAEQSVFLVSQGRLREDLQPIRDVLALYYDHVERLSRDPDERMGIPTGFLDLDRLLGGMQRSDLLIIAGRPGQGKTGFMLSAAKNAAQLHRKHVAVFSLEMSNEQLAQRLVAQETSIDSLRLRLGELKDDEWPRFTDAVSALSDTAIYMDDAPAISPLQLRSKCRRLHSEVGLDLVIVDYLQLMSGDSRVDNRVQEVSYISRNLKALARELNVPVLAGAQLSRAVEQRSDKRAVLSDLRESGSLEQDADVVMFIHRPDSQEADNAPFSVAEIVVAKHRNGPVGSVQLIFRSALAKFENAETRRVDLSRAG